MVFSDQRLLGRSQNAIQFSVSELHDVSNLDGGFHLDPFSFLEITRHAPVLEELGFPLERLGTGSNDEGVVAGQSEELVLEVLVAFEVLFLNLVVVVPKRGVLLESEKLGMAVGRASQSEELLEGERNVIYLVKVEQVNDKLGALGSLFESHLEPTLGRHQ